MQWLPQNVPYLPPYPRDWLTVLSVAVICGVAAAILTVPLIFSRNLPSAVFTIGVLVTFAAACLVAFLIWVGPLALPDEAITELKTAYYLPLRAFLLRSVIAGLGLGAILSGAKLIHEPETRKVFLSGLSMVTAGCGFIGGTVAIMLTV